MIREDWSASTFFTVRCDGTSIFQLDAGTVDDGIALGVVVSASGFFVKGGFVPTSTDGGSMLCDPPLDEGEISTIGVAKPAAVFAFEDPEVVFIESAKSPLDLFAVVGEEVAWLPTDPVPDATIPSTASEADGVAFVDDPDDVVGSDEFSLGSVPATDPFAMLGFPVDPVEVVSTPEVFDPDEAAVVGNSDEMIVAEDPSLEAA